MRQCAKEVESEADSKCPDTTEIRKWGGKKEIHALGSGDCHPSVTTNGKALLL